MEKGTLSAHEGAAAGHQQWFCRALSSGSISVNENSEKKRKISDGVLMVVNAQIYGHPVRALIDSGATRCFISLSTVIPLGLNTIKDCTFLELGDGHKILSKGKVVNAPIVTADLTVKMDLVVTSILHDVELIMDINCLQAVNPLIDWSSSLIFLPKEVGISVLPHSWIDQAHKIGTIKVL